MITYYFPSAVSSRNYSRSKQNLTILRESNTILAEDYQKFHKSIQGTIDHCYKIDAVHIWQLRQLNPFSSTFFIELITNVVNFVLQTHTKRP